MSAVTATRPGSAYTDEGITTLNELISYAHSRLDTAGVHLSPAKINKTMRRVRREGDAKLAIAAVDSWILEGQTVSTFEAWVTVRLQYADPTGNKAARIVDSGQTTEKRDIAAEIRDLNNVKPKRPCSRTNGSV